MPGIRRLFLDIETSPCIVCSWRVGYKISINYENILRERQIICIGYKWEGDKHARVVAWDENQCDQKLLEFFVQLVEEADEIVGHNLDRFDVPWIRTRALFHKLKPWPHPLKTIDTLQWARRYFYFNSNRLDYLARYLGIGSKIKTEFDLWKEILLDKNNTALAKMKRYCRRDVELLEKVYNRFKAVCPVKTHVGVLEGKEKWSCPNCGSEDVKKHDKKTIASGIQRRQMQCKAKGCGRYYIISLITETKYDDDKKEKKQLLLPKGRP